MDRLGEERRNVQLRGRDRELGQVSTLLDRVEHGEGGACVMLGPSGIGKSRLLQEGVALASARSFRVLAVQSNPFDQRLAYAPFLQLLGPYLAELKPAVRTALTRGLDALAQLFADLGLPAPQLLHDPGLQRTRLFDAITRLCIRIADEAPLILCFDDLQYADANSVELFAYLARAAADAPLLLLAACNTDHLAENPDPTNAIRSLSKGRFCRTHDVGPLGGEDLLRIARDALGSEPPGNLLHLLHTRTGGNPLFAIEWISDLIERGDLLRRHGAWVLVDERPGEVPPHIQDVISERLERLTPQARQLLDLISTYGGAMELQLLRTVAGMSENALDRGITHLLAQQVVSETPRSNRPAFMPSHPLVSEVSYRVLSPVARQRYHLAIIDALERLPDSPLDRMAFHYRMAGDQARSTRALEVMIAAGERAMSLYSYREAVDCFEVAWAWIRAGTIGENPNPLARLLDQLGLAYEHLGEYAASERARKESLALFERAGDVRAVARVRMYLATTAWPQNRREEAESHLDAGLAALDGAPVSPELVRLHHTRVVMRQRSGRREGLHAAARAALEAAKRLGDPVLMALARQSEVIYLFDAWELGADRFAEIQRVIAETETMGDALSLHNAASVGCAAGLTFGYPSTACDFAQKMIQIGRRLGVIPLQMWGSLFLAIAKWYLGDWAEADRIGARLMALHHRLPSSRERALCLCVWGRILAGLGETAESEACLKEAHSIYSEGLKTDRHAAAILRWAQTGLAIESGRPDCLPLGPDDLDGEMHINAFAGRMGEIAEVFIERGDVETARSALSRLGRDDSPLSKAMTARVRALLARRAGDLSSAAAQFAVAAELFDSMAMTVCAAESRLDRAELRGTVSSAAEQFELRGLLSLFRRVGSPRLIKRAERLLQRSRTGITSAPGQTTHQAETPQREALTPRQWEVAELVARGHSNAEIAERLVISARTVTTHLSHIFNRLDLRSRTALARYVFEQATTSQN